MQQSPDVMVAVTETEIDLIISVMETEIERTEYVYNHANATRKLQLSAKITRMKRALDKLKGLKRE